MFFCSCRIYDGTTFKNDVEIWNYFSKHLLPIMNPNCKALPDSTMLAFAIYLFKHLAGRPVEECPFFVNVETIRMGVAMLSSSESSESKSSATFTSSSVPVISSFETPMETEIATTSGDLDPDHTDKEIEITVAKNLESVSINDN